MNFAWYNFCPVHGTLRVTPQWKRDTQTTCAFWADILRLQEGGINAVEI